MLFLNGKIIYRIPLWVDTGLNKTIFIDEKKRQAIIHKRMLG